jgi:hypothetical protein
MTTAAPVATLTLNFVRQNTSIIPPTIPAGHPGTLKYPARNIVYTKYVSSGYIQYSINQSLLDRQLLTPWNSSVFQVENNK